MKNTILIALIALSNSVFANSVSTVNFDEVDAVISNGKHILIEDLRDGFETVKGVQVNDSSVSISNDSKAIILLKNSDRNNSLHTISISARVGGDGGGG